MAILTAKWNFERGLIINHIVKKQWKVIESAPCSAAANMEYDVQLLAHLEHQPILHFYAWERVAATYGYFIKPQDYFLEGQSVDLARRPTGGGVIFHHCDLAFSVLIPSDHSLFSTHTLTNYRTINQLVSTAVAAYRGESITLLSAPSCQHTCTGAFCMAKPTIYDLLWKGKKIGGAAQRRTKQGLLHQGSLSLSLPTSSFLAPILREGETLAHQMEQESLPLMNPTADLERERKKLKDLLVESFSCTNP